MIHIIHFILYNRGLRHYCYKNVATNICPKMLPKVFLNRHIATNMLPLSFTTDMLSQIFITDTLLKTYCNKYLSQTHSYKYVSTNICQSKKLFQQTSCNKHLSQTHCYKQDAKMFVTDTLQQPCCNKYLSQTPFQANTAIYILPKIYSLTRNLSRFFSEIFIWNKHISKVDIEIQSA